MDQVNRDNAGYLEIAWEYHTGELSDGSDGRPETTFQATPILVDGVLYEATAVRGTLLCPVKWSRTAPQLAKQLSSDIALQAPLDVADGLALSEATLHVVLCGAVLTHADSTMVWSALLSCRSPDLFSR